MYKAVLVDDEILEREGIRSLIPWAELGLELAGEASSATKALEIIRKIEPDILITDIRMPGKNGIDMVSQIKTFLPDIKVVFISGYQDFQYAQKAISLDAFGYVLKPVNEIELTEVLQKIVRQLEESESDEAERRIIQKQLEESLPVVRRQRLKALLEGGLSLTEAGQGQTPGLPWHAGCFYVAAVSVGGHEAPGGCHTAPDIPQKLLDIWNGAARPGVSAEAVMMREDLCALVIHDEAGGYEQADMPADDLQSVIRALNRQYGLEASAGLSTRGTGLWELPSLYGQAEIAARRKWHLGKGHVISAGQTEEKPEPPDEAARDMTEVQKKINRHIIDGDGAAAARTVHDFFDSLTENERKNRQRVQNYCLIIINGMESMFAMRGEKPGSGFPSLVTLIDELLLMETLAETRAWMAGRLGEMAEYIAAGNSAPGKALVNKIIHIIEEDYARSLTVTAFAREVFLSPNYIRRIFKKETGKTILEYITETRMSKAAEFMRTPRFTIKEIAEKVGFENTSYFGLIFKQYYGVTPGEYMKSVNRL